MDNDDTGKNGGLSLAEQARFGLLPDALHIEQIATLEHPDDWAVRKAFALCLLQACENAEIPSISGLQYDDGWIDDPQGLRLWWKPLHLNENGPTPMVSRQAYRAWQAQCPKSWLSERSKIDEWLGATPAVETLPPGEPSLPELTALAVLPEPVAELSYSQQDKLDCQKIARELWVEHPEWIQADLLKQSRIAAYANKWPGKNTVPGWLSEVDPRPKERRRGRPPKIR